jgi:hypothetical protein
MLGSLDLNYRFTIKFSFIILAFILLFILLPHNKADAATRINKGVSDQVLNYFYVGYGWGSITYHLSIDEDSTYTYRQELTYHQVRANYYASCVYSCKLDHVAGYKESVGSLKTLSGISSYGSSSKYAYYNAGSPWKTYSAGNYSAIYSRAGYRITLTVSPTLWVNRSSSWLTGETNSHVFSL